jgi:biopolymer transport protein TolQ
MQPLLDLVVGAAQQHTAWELIKKASPMVQGVMVLLALMFLVCLYIIVFKGLFIARATKESNQFNEAFWRSKDIEQIYRVAKALKNSPVSSMFLAGYTELAKLVGDDETQAPSDRDLDNIVRSLRKAQTNETTRLESMTAFLATTGSAAPFIGLFGTVWGIMNSFTAIANKGSATIPDVAPGIAEALIATAIGLVAAIPAVIAYNYFMRKIQVQVSTMETFDKDFLNIVRRHFLK